MIKLIPMVTIGLIIYSPLSDNKKERALVFIIDEFSINLDPMSIPVSRIMTKYMTQVHDLEKINI